jgi:hypothetical protein
MQRLRLRVAPAPLRYLLLDDLVRPVRDGDGVGQGRAGVGQGKGRAGQGRVGQGDWQGTRRKGHEYPGMSWRKARALVSDLRSQSGSSRAQLAAGVYAMSLLIDGAGGTIDTCEEESPLQI